MIFSQATMQQQQQQQQQPPPTLPLNKQHEQSPSTSLGQPHTAPSHSSPSSINPQLNLPERNVTAETIEEAYVQFIMYCNPALPPDTDTASLREAFRVPPRSGGKIFSTMTLFQLIRQLDTKEIKTWAELALKLGVEPPDQDKGQSSQRIQQYAVRLKRWMHSMHMDAFFEYLMGHSHPYWTKIPKDPNPVCEAGRDGVLAEDDMALRALLPQIRPRRGRKRMEDDDLAQNCSQRARVDSPPPLNGFRSVRDGSASWSAHPDEQTTLSCPDPLRSSSTTTLASGWLQLPDTAQTPLSAYPQGSMSATTPSTNRIGFWGDAEPRSAITPSKPKPLHRRHGAKVVSSAWRSGGPGATGKARGRPPMSKANADGPATPLPVEGPAYKMPSPGVDLQLLAAPEATTPQSAPPTVPTDSLPPPPALPRPTKPNISLQVPERHGGAIRLATPPPPAVTVNGDLTYDVNNESRPAPTATRSSIRPHAVQPRQTPEQVPPAANGDESKSNDLVGMFEKMEDRTNIDAVVSYFIHETVNGEWTDARGNPIETCSMAEVHALVHTILERMWETATNQDAFLINLAALVGARALMTTSKVKVKRTVEYGDRATYCCAWELRMGSMRGKYNMVQTVMYNRWKKTREEQPMSTEATEKASESMWEKRYKDLLALAEKRDRDMLELRSGLLRTLNQTFGDAKALDERQVRTPKS